MNIINYFRNSQHYSLYNNHNHIFHQINDLDSSNNNNNNNNGSTSTNTSTNTSTSTTSSNNINQKQQTLQNQQPNAQSNNSSSSSSSTSFQQQQLQNGKYIGNTNVNRTSSFTPSPVLFMTPMAPIDYGISDDMLLEEKLDSCPSATTSPAFSSEQDAIVPDYISSMMMSCIDSELNIKYGVSSFQGTRRYMEDRQKIKTGFDNNPHVSLFGVFDGHGGYKCAEFVKKRIVQYMNKFLKENKTGYSSGKNSNGSSAASSPAMYESPNWLKKNVIGCGSYNEIQQRSEFLQQALYNTFQTLDNRYFKKYRQKNESGTTCLVALLSAPPNLQPLLIVANAGDSRGVLCRNGKAIALSFDHKPDNPKEKQRITAAGGKVEWDYYEKIWRVAGVLSVSRGIGDIPLKKWVVCDPDFVVIPLKCLTPNGSSSNSSRNNSSGGKLFGGYSTSSSPANSPAISKISPKSSSSPFSPKLLLSRKSKRHSSPVNFQSTPISSSSPLSSSSSSISPSSPSSPDSTSSPNISTNHRDCSAIAALSSGERSPLPKSDDNEHIVPDIDQSVPIEMVNHQHRNHLKSSTGLSSPASSPKLSRRQSIGVVKKSTLSGCSANNTLNQKGNYSVSKTKNCSPIQPTATPNIEIDQYFVIATDGIWDAFTNQELVDFINNTIYDIYTTKRLDWDPTDIAKRVTMEACIRGSGDNSTIIIVKCLSQ